ncbi:MAG: hypothetical protein ABI054_13305 [Planctomycetota bacterium]
MKSPRLSLAFVLGALMLLSAGIGFRVFTQRERVRAGANPESASRGEPLTGPALELPEARDQRAPAADSSAPVAKEDAKAAKDMLGILVLDACGNPVDGAMVGVARGDQLIGRELTHSDGIVHFQAFEGSGRYVLLAPGGGESFQGEIDLGPGLRIITIFQGTGLAGRVLIDGAAPGAPFELTWRSDGRMLNIYEGLVGKYEVFGDLRDNRSSYQEFKTGADGRFKICGLPKDATGTLRWTAPCFLENAGDGYDACQFEVRELGNDLLLQLVAGVEIVFRVVDFAGEPLLGAHAFVMLERENPGLQSSYALAGDRQGEMRLALLRDSIGPIRVAVGWTDTSTPRAYAFEPPLALGTTWDLGTLTAFETRPITVIVKDEQGEPIHGASATAWLPRTEDAGWRDCGSGNRVIVDVSTESCEVAVRAFGYCGARVPVPPKTWYVTATLARACVLVLETSTKFEQSDEVQLEIQGQSPMFIDEAPDSPEASRTNLGYGKLAHPGGAATFQLDLPKERDSIAGRMAVEQMLSGLSQRASGLPRIWQVGALTPSQPLHAIVKSNGTQLCDIEIAPLFPGEQRRVMLEIPSGH